MRAGWADGSSPVVRVIVYQLTLFGRACAKIGQSLWGPSAAALSVAAMSGLAIAIADMVTHSDAGDAYFGLPAPSTE